MVGLTGIRSISRPPLKVQKVSGLYRRGAREGGRETEGVRTREKGHVPCVPRLRRHDIGNAAEPTAFNVAPARRPVVAPGTIRRLANAGGNEGGKGSGVARY